MSKSKIPARGRIPFAAQHNINTVCQIGHADLQIVEMYVQPQAFRPDDHGVTQVAVLKVGRETYRSDDVRYHGRSMVRGDELVRYALTYLLLNGGRVTAGRAGVKDNMKMYGREIPADAAINFALGPKGCDELGRTYVPWYEMADHLHPKKAA